MQGPRYFCITLEGRAQGVCVPLCLITSTSQLVDNEQLTVANEEGSKGFLKLYITASIDLEGVSKKSLGEILGNRGSVRRSWFSCSDKPPAGTE